MGNKNILLITKDKIKAFKVKGETETELLTEYAWNEESLDLILSKIKTVLGANVRILLDEELCYMCGFSLPNNFQIDRQEIQEKAQGYISENLSETRWDFKETITDDRRYIQVVAIVKTFFDRLNTSAVKARLNIEAVEPASYSLARMVDKEKEPLIMVYLLQESSFLAVVYHGLVYFSKKIISDKATDEVMEAKDLSMSKFQLEPKKIVINKKDGVDEKLLEINNFKIEFRNLNIYFGLSEKKDLQGNDEDTLNLEPVLERGLEKPAKGPMSFLVGVLIGLIILGLGYWFWVNKSSKKETLIKIAATPTATQEIGRSEYKIQILNGIGEEGVAGELKTVLEDEKFTVIATDNADNYDYETTEVRYKKNVDNDFRKDLNNELEKQYVVKEGEELINSSDYDAIIIIGQT